MIAYRVREHNRTSQTTKIRKQGETKQSEKKSKTKQMYHTKENNMLRPVYEQQQYGCNVTILAGHLVSRHTLEKGRKPICCVFNMPPAVISRAMGNRRTLKTADARPVQQISIPFSVVNFFVRVYPKENHCKG